MAASDSQLEGFRTAYYHIEVGREGERLRFGSLELLKRQRLDVAKGPCRNMFKVRLCAYRIFFEIILFG
jgi:hypothetical protein